MQRLAKVMAAAGIASRRKCEQIIEAGRVTVNGRRERVPQTMVDVDDDTIFVDGERIGTEEKVYYLLNKPVGYVCSATPPKQGQRVLDLFTGIKSRLFTVGRLDRDTSGLLLVTNDGQAANRIIHPRYGIEKEYIATTDQPIRISHLREIKAGTRIEGVFVEPLRVERVSSHQVRVVVAEGKKREVRILIGDVGLRVAELQRVRVGKLRLGRLPLGRPREVSLEVFESVYS